MQVIRLIANQFTPLPRLPISARQLSLLLSILVILSNACGPMTPSPASTAGAPAPVTSQHATLADAPRIPDQPDLVTIVPFQFAAVPGPGFILFPAQVDDLYGTFLLDTGSPVVILNRAYIRPGHDGGIDTVTPLGHRCLPSGAGGVRAVTMQTVRIGTLRQTLDPFTVGSPKGKDLLPPPANAFLGDDARLGMFGQPVLGFFGLNALEPFETIIDYRHKRLILIRLDAAGRRRVAVPAYTPMRTMPLLPMPDQEHWGVAEWPGVPDTVIVDTGGGMFTDSTEVIGYPSLSRRGVVGFNFRTRQLVLYRNIAK